jgi:hypothetical protein
MKALPPLCTYEPGLWHSIYVFFRDDILYRYLNVYPMKHLCEGNILHSNHVEYVPPIHRLPVELLAEIFRHYVQIVDHPRASLSLSVRPHSQITPFLLGEVCDHWKRITTSTGDLWQSIYIDPPRMEHIPLVRLWLSHARNYPLSLCLFQSGSPDDSELQATNEILSLFVRRLNRWKSIVFCFSANVPPALMDLPHGAAASLEAARVDARRWDRASADNLWRALHSSPTLSRPDWANLYWSAPPSHAPWAQLTHIILEGSLSTDVVLGVLQHCQSVVNLDLAHLVSSTTSFHSSPVVLAHLRDAHISTEIGLGSLFQSLLLPSLTSLDVTYRHDAFNGCSPRYLDDLIRRSQCQLDKLILRDADANATEDQILDYLRAPALQSLVELQLSNPVSDTTIRSLSKHGGKEQLLPRLQALSLTCCTSDGVLSDMIISRLPTIRTIHVSLRRLSHSYRQDQATLNYLRKNIDVEVMLQ